MGVVAEVTPQYRGQKVVIIQDSAAADGLIQIQDGDGNECWIRKNKLVFPVVRPPSSPVYLSHAVAEAAPEFVDYLQTSDYTLHVVCRNEEQVVRAKLEYSKWSGGKTLSDSAILESFDESKWDREWFLIFQYSPDIAYPFSVLERGTGGGKRSPEPVAWHRRGRIESCYAAIAASLVTAGLEARY